MTLQDSAADGGQTEWGLYEVFVQTKQGAPHEHFGSVHATDPEQALQNARDVYGRRDKAISMWVVPSNQITATTPSDVGPFFEASYDKPYRHPSFYTIPRGVRNL